MLESTFAQQKKGWQNDAKTSTGRALLMLYAFHTRFIPVYIPAGGKLARRLSRTVQKRIKKGMQGAHPLMQYALARAVKNGSENDDKKECKGRAH